MRSSPAFSVALFQRASQASDWPSMRAWLTTAIGLVGSKKPRMRLSNAVSLTLCDAPLQRKPTSLLSPRSGVGRVGVAGDAQGGGPTVAHAAFHTGAELFGALRGARVAPRAVVEMHQAVAEHQSRVQRPMFVELEAHSPRQRSLPKPVV